MKWAIRSRRWLTPRRVRRQRRMRGRRVRKELKQVVIFLPSLISLLGSYVGCRIAWSRETALTHTRLRRQLLGNLYRTTICTVTTTSTFGLRRRGKMYQTQMRYGREGRGSNWLKIIPLDEAVDKENKMVSYTLDYEQQPTTVITFRLTGDSLRPEIITETLGVIPFKAWAKGDVKKRAGNYYTFGCWSLIPTCSKYDPFETQLNQLLDQLEALPPALHEFVKMFHAEISVGYSSGESNFGFTVDRRAIERLYRLGVVLDFDIYTVHQDDDTEEA